MSPWHSVCPRVGAEQQNGSAGQVSCSLSQWTQPSQCSWSSPSGSSTTWRRKGGCDAFCLQLKAKNTVGWALLFYQLSSSCPLCMCPRSVLWSCVCDQCCKVQGKVSFQKQSASLFWRWKLSTDSLKHMDLFLFFLPEAGFWGCIYHATQACW